MNAKMVLTGMLRESRGARGRLLFFVGCLAIGVAAVTGVAAMVTSVEAGIRAQSRDLLAADLRVTGRRPLPDELVEFFEDIPHERADVREMAAMASAGSSRLVELKVVQGRYPFYGELELEPAGSLDDLLTPETVLAAPDLLAGLGLEVGDELSIGGSPFTIAATVLDEPDRLDFAMTLGPRVFMSDQGLVRTNLGAWGNRVRYRALYRLDGFEDLDDLHALERRLRDELPGAGYLRFRTHDEVQPSVRRGLRRAERYLGLVALLSLVLGGIGVAQIVRAWLSGRVLGVAILRCLGFRPRDVLAFYLAHVLLLALVGSLLGVAIGAAIPWVVSLGAPELFGPESLVGVRWWALARGLVLGVGVAVVFSLPPLTSIWRVPPARALRAEAAPLPVSRSVRWGSMAALVVGVFASARLQSGETDVAAVFTVGLFVLAGMLAAGAWGLMRLSARLPRTSLSPYLRHGVAALARPGAGTTGAVVALGLGVLVVVAILVVERRLGNQLRTALPPDAPSTFLVDIQPDQWEGVSTALVDGGASRVDSVPVIMARLSEIDGRSVEDIVREGRGRSWVFTREQRLTWLEELPDDNVVVSGELWSDPIAAEVSLEEGFARDLGAEVGTRLRFDVQGIPIDLLVTSIRTVEWQSFAINFFLVVEPGVLDDAPQFRLAAARLTEEGERRVQDTLATSFPNVTLLGVRPILEKILEAMSRIAFGVRLLGSFTVLVGITILAGSVASTALRRGREAALYKTLGVTRRGVTALFAVEYALSGLVAGTVGGLGALALAWGFLERMVEIEADLPFVAVPVAAIACAVLAAGCGVLASAKALAVRPLATLRAES